MKHSFTRFLKIVLFWVIALLCVPNVKLHAQEHAGIKGTVVDEQQVPLGGVSVKLKKSGSFDSTGTVTNVKGMFSFEGLTPDVTYSLTFTHVGYELQSKSVHVKQNESSSVLIRLISGSSGLDEVVIVGYGSQKKVNLTGAVSQVSGEVLSDRPMPSISRGLQGVIPNLNITMSDGKPTRSPAFNIRGVTSIGTGGSALVLIDGVAGDPNLLNPNDVESVTVLKDAASAAVYGARGSFGVV